MPVPTIQAISRTQILVFFGSRRRRLANIKNNAAAQRTQRRLLEAAGKVFAERGYHLATVKEITDRAGSALASVNYHFGDKAELYAAVLARIEIAIAGVLPPDDVVTGTKWGRLRRFVWHVAVKMIGRERPAWERMLLARELAQPSPALDPLIETVARPLHEKLSLLIAEATGRRPDENDVALDTCSIVAQCVYHMEHRALLQRLHPELGSRPAVDRLADHIAEFSLAAIRAKARKHVRKCEAGTRRARRSRAR